MHWCAWHEGGPAHVQEAPLLRQLLSSSTAEHAAERLWLVRLLAAGFRSQEEGDIFRCPSAQRRSMGTELASNTRTCPAKLALLCRGCGFAIHYGRLCQSSVSMCSLLTAGWPAGASLWESC